MSERKILPAAALKVGTATGDEPQVELRFATFGVVDHDGDYTLPGAFEDGARVAIGAFGHSTVLAGQAPVGWGTIRNSATNAKLVGRFLTTQAGQEARTIGKELKDILEVSYSFPPPELGEVTPELRKAGVHRVLRRVKVLEVSMCLQGAGISTGIVVAKCSGCGQPHGAACSRTPPSQPDPAELSPEAQAEIALALKQLHRNQALLDDAAEMALALKRFHRNQALADALKEPNGLLALDVAEKATRWLTNGRMIDGKQQQPPMVKFMDPDGKSNGCYKPSDPDSIYLSRGLSDEECVRTAAHEVSHFLRPWDSREEIARLEEQIISDRYFQSSERLASRA